jgi:catechol-2,3-dioxygenase
MSPPARLAHIVFNTNDLPAMLAWYRTTLEAETVFATDKIAFLSYDEEHHRIALVATQEFAPHPPENAVGFYHAAFAYSSLGALLDNHDRLAAAGIRPYRTINHGPTISFYYKDPDGNALEFQVDRFASAEHAKNWMATSPAYARNPVGIAVSPGELRKQLDAGIPWEAIARRDDE